MKKLLFFINSLGGGGAEKVLVDLVNLLDHNKYKVDVVSVTGGVHENRLSPQVNFYKIVKTENKFLKELLTRIIYHLPFSLVYKLVKKDEYDIEIAYLEGFPTRVIAAGKSKAKKLAFVHCDVSVCDVLSAFYKNKQICIAEYSKFDKACFVSEVAKSGFEKIVGHLPNATVVHNVIDFGSVEAKSHEENNCNYVTKGVKMIAVGRLSKEKGFYRLVEVVAELEGKYDFELWMVGDGPLRPEIDDIINEKELKSIKMVGFQNNPYSYIKKADILVCSSFYEGYSTVVAEALSIGTPIITTDCAGMNELLENGRYGIVVENSKEGLKDGLEAILSNKQLLIGLKKSLDNREPRNNMREYETLFNSLFDI